MRNDTVDDGAPGGVGVHKLVVTLRDRERAIEGRLSLTTPGLPAIGAMVSSILLGMATIVMASTRELPEPTRRRDE